MLKRIRFAIDLRIPHILLIQRAMSRERSDANQSFHLIRLLAILIMQVHDMLRQFLISLRVRLIDHEEDQIEAGKDSIGDLGVLHEGFVLVVAAVDGVC